VRYLVGRRYGTVLARVQSNFRNALLSSVLSETDRVHDGRPRSGVRVLAAVEIILYGIRTRFVAHQTSYQMRCSTGVLSPVVSLVPRLKLCGTALEFPHSFSSLATGGQLYCALVATSHA
jgi:hypothetical protein